MSRETLAQLKEGLMSHKNDDYAHPLAFLIFSFLYYFLKLAADSAVGGIDHEVSYYLTQAIDQIESEHCLSRFYHYCVEALTEYELLQW